MSSMRPIALVLGAGIALGTSACTEERRPFTTGTGTPPPAAVVPRPGRDFSAVPLDRFCEARSEAECHRLAVCGPRRLQSAYGDEATCVAERTELCHRGFIELSAEIVVELGLVRIDADRLGEAFTEFSRRHCSSLVGPPSPLVAAVGLVSDGSACTAHQVCTSGFCDNGFGGCGRCAQPPTDRPRTCSDPCPLGSACSCVRSDGGLGDCTCSPAIAEGAECTPTGAACDEGLTCLEYRDRAGTRHQRCVRAPVQGESCGPATGFSSCIGDAYCEAESDRGTCRAPLVVGVGATCDDQTRLCPPGHDCRGRCVPRADRGQACVSPQATTIPDGGPPTCREGFCSGTCIDPLGEGNFCVTAADCRQDLGCNRAVLFGGGTCESNERMREQVRAAFTCR